jgi:hypothetical protein
LWDFLLCGVSNIDDNRDSRVCFCSSVKSSAISEEFNRSSIELVRLLNVLTGASTWISSTVGVRTGEVLLGLAFVGVFFFFGSGSSLLAGGDRFRNVLVDISKIFLAHHSFW